MRPCLTPVLCFASGFAFAMPALAATPAVSPAFDVTQFQFEPSVPWLSAGNGLTDNHYNPSEILLGRYTLPYVFKKWEFSADGEVQGTPSVEGNSVYIADAGGSVWQLDAATGKKVWQANLPALTGDPMSFSRNSPAIGTSTVILGDQASSNLFALSKTTGTLVWKTTLESNPDGIVTSSPIIANGVIYVGLASDEETTASKVPNFVPSFRGSVVAVDERTGKVLWQTYTVPTGYTGGAVWASNLAFDATRGVLYGTSGDNYTVPQSVKACQEAATTPEQLSACLSPEDHIDSVYALDAKTGAFRWSQRFTNGDTWTVSCETFAKSRATPCPTPTGLDTDFGAGPNLFTVKRNGTEIDAVGAGQKSGTYFTMDRDTGQLIWATPAGPDGVIGGIQWGAATDGNRIYFSEANSAYVDTTLAPSGQKTNGGFWTALDVNTGQILWQTPTFAPAPVPQSGRAQNPPAGAKAISGGSVTVANGVVYGEDAAGMFVALDAATGEVLRSFPSGAASIAGPAIADGTLYWVSGYKGVGQTNNKVYALWLGLH